MSTGKSSHVRVLIVLVTAFSGAIALTGCSARHASVANAGDQKTAWMRQKSIECQGDMRKLSAEDQQKLQALYGFPGAPSMIANAYRQSKGEQ